MILQVPKRMPTYVHTQVSPASEWWVVHMQGKYPSVTCVDDGGVEMMCRRDYPDANTVKLVHSSPRTGKALLN